MNLNKAQLIGRTTRDIELKTLPSGTTVASFSLATNRTWKQDGQKKEATTFHNIVAFGKTAEILAQYVHKGDEIMIEGRIENRSWEGTDGKKQYRSEIIVENFQFGAKKQGSSQTSASSRREDDQRDPGEGIDDSGDINPDDIPF